MRILIFILLLSFQVKSQRDILYHQLAGTAISIGSGLITYKCTDRIGVSMLVGAVTGIAVGIAKEEIYDRKWKRGTPSDNDKLATGWGSCVGSIGFVMIIGTRQNILDDKWERLNKFNFQIDTNEARHKRHN